MLFSPRRSAPRLPNLLCVGVEKAGTTFLNNAFTRCPFILTPRNKELFYFNKNYHEGEDWYLSRYPFQTKRHAPWVADVTPSYFRNQAALERIARDLDDPKIIVVLRHPVYRAFSHYVQRLRPEAESLACYDRAFEEERARDGVRALLFPPYGKLMRRLLDYFPRENILLLTYEEDILKPASAEARLRKFLGLPDLDFSILGHRPINEGRMPRFYWSEADGPVLPINGVRYALPRDALVFASNRGTRVYRDIDPARARANWQASRSWTAHLGGDAVQRIYREQFADDLELLRSDFAIDINRWSAMDEPVQYAPAVPSVSTLRRLD